MDNLSKLTLAVRDYGLFMHLAQDCAREYKEILYYVPWEGSYPTTDKANIGVGVPGLTRVYDWHEAVRQADEVALFDVGMDSIRQSVIKEFKKPCMGGTASIMEYNRIYFKEECLRKMGLPVIPYKVIIGWDALCLHLKSNPNKHVKVNTFRGVLETFHAKDYKFAIPKLEMAAKKLGSWKNKMPFIVEDHVPGFQEQADGAVETGDDDFKLHGDPLSIGTWGFEIKDNTYVCKVDDLDNFPTPLKEIRKKLNSVFRDHDVCGMGSSEIRRNTQKSFYLDDCRRAGSPPSEIQGELFTNFPRIVHAIANNQRIVPAFKAKYGAMILIKSEMALETHVPMDFKDQDLKVLKMRNLYKVDDQYYHIPQDGLSFLGAAIGWGNDKETAMDMALENSQKIQCDEAHCEVDGFEKQKEVFKAAVKVGLGTF